MIDFRKTFSWATILMRLAPTAPKGSEAFIALQFTQEGGAQLIIPTNPEMARSMAAGLIECADKFEAETAVRH